MPRISKETNNTHAYEGYYKCHNLTYPTLANPEIYNLFLTVNAMSYLMLRHGKNTFWSVMHDFLVSLEILWGRKRTAKGLSLYHGRESVGYNGTLFGVSDILENLVKIHRGRMTFVGFFWLFLCFFFHNAYRRYFLIAFLKS